MPLWLWILMLAAVIKLPIAGLMLWLPFRYDEAMNTPPEQDSSSDDDGGSRALPAGPLDPRPHQHTPFPRRPRRGPHGSPPPHPPARNRRPARRLRPVRLPR